ncbi:MAG: hypothetical protein K0Q87_4941, partial [Neobacillus sp.]|nr:hypothetical protein [Neobacillus sp.]
MKKKLKRFFAIFLCVFVISNVVVTARADAAVLPIITVGALLLAVVAIVATTQGVKLDITNKDELTTFAYTYFNQRSASDSSFSSWWQNIKNKSYDATVLGLSLAAVTQSQLKSMFKYTISTAAFVQCVLSVHIREVIVDMIKAYYGYASLVAGDVNKDGKNDIMEYVNAQTGLSIPLETEVFSYPYVVLLRYTMYPYASRYYVVGSITKPIIEVYDNDKKFTLLFPEFSYVLSILQTNTSTNTWTIDKALIHQEKNDLSGLSDLYNQSYKILYMPSGISYNTQILNESLLGDYIKGINFDMSFVSGLNSNVVLAALLSKSMSYSISASAYAMDFLNEDEQPIPISFWLNDYFESALKNTNIDNIAESTNTDAIVNAIDKGNIAAVREGSKVIDVDITDA